MGARPAHTRRTLLLCVLLQLPGCGGSVIELRNTQFEPQGFWTTAEPVWSKEDVDGKKRPHVHLDADFSRSTGGLSGHLDVLMFRAEAMAEVGAQPNTAADDEAGEPEIILCCVPKLLNEGLCGHAEAGEVIRTPDYTGIYDRVPVAANATTVKYNPAKWPISESGYYTILVVSCSLTELGIDTIDGEVQFLNAYGYLPAHLHGYLPFWMGMFAAYAIVGGAWLVLALCNWRDLLHLQILISGIIFVGMVEACSWNILFVTYNDSGQISLAASIFASVMGTTKKTCGRLLILVVSMGYGVVKPTLGENAKRVVLLSAVYFVCATMLEIVEWVGHNQKIPMLVRLVFVLPVAILDLTFSVWIFSSLSTTTANLQARKQQSKLRLYKRFTRLMTVCVLLSLCWSSYEVYVTSRPETFHLRWKSYWQLEAVWPVIFFMVLVVIMWLWAPSKNAIRYAYSEELSLEDDYCSGDDDDDEEPSNGDEALGGTSMKMEQLPASQDGGDDKRL